MQGCTGGTFLSQDIAAIHEWVDFDGPYLLVDFNRAPINNTNPPPEWNTEYNFYLSRSVLEENKWWLWNDFLPQSEVTRPPWWHVNNMEDAKVRMLVFLWYSY